MQPGKREWTNVLLIEPLKSTLTIGGEDIFLFEPLALEYVAAGVVAEHDVHILDMRVDRDLPAALARVKPDVVGITSLTTHVNTVKRLFEQAKRWNPRVLTAVGGHHATVAPEDFQTPFIDLIVMGEGVFAFQEIVSRVARGTTFDGIPGVAFQRDGALAAPPRQASHGLSGLRPNRTAPPVVFLSPGWPRSRSTPPGKRSSCLRLTRVRPAPVVPCSSPSHRRKACRSRARGRLCSSTSIGEEHSGDRTANALLSCFVMLRAALYATLRDGVRLPACRSGRPEGVRAADYRDRTPDDGEAMSASARRIAWHHDRRKEAPHKAEPG